MHQSLSSSVMTRMSVFWSLVAAGSTIAVCALQNQYIGCINIWLLRNCAVHFHHYNPIKNEAIFKIINGGSSY